MLRHIRKHSLRSPQTAQMAPDLAAVVEARPHLPEALKPSSW